MKIAKFILLTGVGFMMFASGYAQQFKYTVPGLDTLSSSLIVQGAAATVLKNGAAEVIVNSFINSYQIAFHGDGRNSPVDDRLRSTQFITDVYGYYGVSTTGMWDVGLHLKYVRSRIDNDAASSVFGVLKNDKITTDPSDLLDRNFGGLASVGIRARVKPLAAHPEFVVNGGYALGVVKDSTQQRQLTADRDVADIGASYYQPIAKNLFYFINGIVQMYLPSTVRDESLYTTALSFYVIKRTNNNKWTIYPGLSYGVSFKPAKFDEQNLIKTTNSLFAVGGMQYVPNSKYNFFATFGFPLQISLVNPQQEIIRPSYSLFGLGFRAAF